ncbi:MAG TPA: hypothetical protein VER03_11850 [Bryobacteraceae bacterium]|nr:hypothetical protein [Bryobacteraceae bacterium]
MPGGVFLTLRGVEPVRIPPIVVTVMVIHTYRLGLTITRRLRPATIFGRLHSERDNQH